MSLRTGIAADVVRAEPAEGYRLKLTFSDGHVSDLDFGSFLRGSMNPETRQFLDEKRFKSFSLVDGNLVWGDYEMCFSIEDLYTGEIDHRVSRERTTAMGGSTRQTSSNLWAVAEPRAKCETRRPARR